MDGTGQLWKGQSFHRAQLVGEALNVIRGIRRSLSSWAKELLDE